MLDLVYENQTGDTKWPEKFFRPVFDKAITRLNIQDKKVELGLHLVTSERSRELNKQYRGKDKPTDVLSFPLNPHTQFDGADSKRGKLSVGVNEHLESYYDILPVGDIFICLEVAKKQADEMKIPLNQELARLAVHGFLHLLGYDHPDDGVSGPRLKRRGEKMIELQEEIVNSLSL